MTITQLTSVPLGADHRPLRAHDSVHLVIRPPVPIVHRRPHRLLGHLALVHVPRALVAVAEWRRARQNAEHEGREELMWYASLGGFSAEVMLTVRKDCSRPPISSMPCRTKRA